MPAPSRRSFSEQPDAPAEPSTPPARRSPRATHPARVRFTVAPWLGRRKLAALVSVTTVTLATLGLIAVFSGHQSDSNGRSGAYEFGHVHGIGVDPATGGVYAGTHFGLFRLGKDGEPRRVADRVQDFMGFTVVGPEHFIASGHPGEGQDGPASLGLIESTDAGRTWKQVSLAGEADFHSLESHGDRIYGLNSLTGQLLTSTDGSDWEERSTLPMADFTADPRNADRIVATTERGLVVSVDGARTFTPAEDAPVLLLVDWADDGTLAGLTPDGKLYVAQTGPRGNSSVESFTWRNSGSIGGPPETFEVVDGETLFAVTGGSVLFSTDGGTNFRRYGT